MRFNIPMNDDEIKMHKPVSCNFVDFRAGIRCAERVYQVVDLIEQATVNQSLITEQAEQGRTFCQRCGKRMGDENSIHTCTPPEEAVNQSLITEKAQPVEVVTYKEVTDTMNALWSGTLQQVQIAEAMKNKKLYTAPPHSQPLTEEEIKPFVQKAMKYYGYDPDKYGKTTSAGFYVLARAIEAAHGIKGEA